MVLAALASGPAAATSDFLSDLVGKDSSGLGVALRAERSLYRGDGLRLDVLPLYLYEGEHLFLRSNRAGLKFEPSPGRRLELFVLRRLESHPVEQIPESLAGMAPRPTESDAGLSYEQRFDWGGSVFVEYLRDTSRTSGGTELRLGASLERSRGGLRLIPYFMLSARNARLIDYYYGVMPSEASAERPAYSAGGGVNGTAGINARYDLSTHWHLLAGLSATYWASQVRASPIVEDRPLQLAGFGGFAYEFEPSPRRRWEEGTPLFVKIFHGRSTGCNLLPILELRCGSTSTDDKTSVDSIELGLPFSEISNASLVGYVGLLRHEERDLQPDFWQVNVYMKAFYWGFPWSKSVRTRIGFGAGLSYAQAVPFVEARSQAERGRNTSKLLQYLDPTVDVSVGDLFGSKRLHETYFGVGVSHRSGIFGMAQLFENVNGGSNYIYTYVEWKM